MTYYDSIQLCLYKVTDKRHSYNIIVNHSEKIGTVIFQRFYKECKKRYTRIRLNLQENLSNKALQEIYDRIVFLLEEKELNIDFTTTYVIGNNSPGVEKIIQMNELELCESFNDDRQLYANNTDIYYFINTERRYGL